MLQRINLLRGGIPDFADDLFLTPLCFGWRVISVHDDGIVVLQADAKVDAVNFRIPE
jgi:hypothetical protein